MDCRRPSVLRKSIMEDTIMQDIGSSSNWFRSLKFANSNDGVDRISALPDKILGHMLSFLPTKNAVGTSVLSHRWRYLFTLVSKLDFDETVHFTRSGDPHIIVAQRCACLRSGEKFPPSSFKDFVDRVLHMCKSPHISSFRLKCTIGFDCSNVSAWIIFALFHGVEEIDIYTYEEKSSILPPLLFSCETLVVLKLRGDFEMKFPESFQLPKLKSLQLSSVKFEDEYSLNRLLSGCPVLEDLKLLGGWEEIEDIIISSPSVRRLTMDFSDGFTSAPYHRTSISLDLPNLIYFNYEDYLAEHYYLKNLNSIEEVRLDFLLDIENMMRDSKKFCTAFLELANGLSAAKFLFFSGKCMQALNCGQEKLPTFNSLTRMELGWTRYINWRVVLPDFLNSAPNLEVLIFSEGIMDRERDDDYDDKTFWSRQRKAPPCLSNIKLIVIEWFNGFNEELQLARYLLRHGKSLQMLVLDWMMKTDEHWKDFKKLKKLADSKGCMITGLKLWSDYEKGLKLSLPCPTNDGAM